MPIFMMLCKKCKQEFEYYKLKESSVAVCPNCGSTEGFEQLPTAATITFKGEGWTTPNYSASVDPTTVPGVQKIELDKQTIDQKTLYKHKKPVTGKRRKVKIKNMKEKKREYVLGKA